VPAAVRFASFITYQLANNERGQSMQEDRTFENKFAPPVRSEKKIGNTTFTVNSFFLEQTKDGVVSKIERLIKDDVRKKPLQFDLHRQTKPTKRGRIKIELHTVFDCQIGGYYVSSVKHRCRASIPLQRYERRSCYRFVLPFIA